MKILILALALFIPPSIYAGESTKVFRSTDYSVSFRYASNWEPVASQASTTLVLLYERSGTSATANLSVIKADRKSVTEYDQQYFSEVFGRRVPGFKLKSIKYIDTISGIMAKLEYDFIMNLQDEKIEMSSLTAIRVNEGLRYMLVVNSIKDRMPRVRPDAEIMFGTFQLIK